MSYWYKLASELTIVNTDTHSSTYIVVVLVALAGNMELDDVDMIVVRGRNV